MCTLNTFMYKQSITRFLIDPVCFDKDENSHNITFIYVISYTYNSVIKEIVLCYIVMMAFKN